MEYLIGSGIIDVSSQQNFGVTELTIGFIPSEKADELTPKAESLARFLESEFNGKVDFKIVVPTNYEIIIEGLNLDILTPHSWIQVLDGLLMIGQMQRS